MRPASAYFLGALLLLCLIGSCKAFTAPPIVSGFNNSGTVDGGDGSHTAQWYSDQEAAHDQEVCMEAEHHLVDKDGNCYCEDGWTGFPSCNLLGPTDGCVVERMTDGSMHESCVAIIPFFCTNEVAFAWNLTVSNSHVANVTDTIFSGVLSLNTKTKTQSICVSSTVDLSTFSVEQEINVKHCLDVANITRLALEVSADVTYRNTQTMNRVALSSSAIDFGTLTVEGTECGSEDYWSIPCNYEQPATDYSVAPALGETAVPFKGNDSCLYIATSGSLFPLCCPSILVAPCQEATVYAACFSGVQLDFELADMSAMEANTQEYCVNNGFEFCLEVDSFALDDDDRRVTGSFSATVTLPGQETVGYELGGFDYTYPVCGHDCAFVPSVSGWDAIFWVVLMNSITVSIFLAVLALIFVAYRALKKSSAVKEPEKDISMVSLLAEEEGEVGDALDMEDDEDDLLG